MVMESQTEMAGDPVVLELEGPLDVQNAGELRDVLMQAMQGKPLALRLNKVVSVDVAILQVLCSVHRTMSASGFNLTIVDEISRSLKKSVADAGYLRERGCALDVYGTCLWSKGGKFYE
jgi:anti-anti-sigma factor